MQRYRGVLVVCDSETRTFNMLRALRRHTSAEAVRSLAALGDLDPIHGDDFWAGIVIASDDPGEVDLARMLVAPGKKLAIEVVALKRPMGDAWRLFLGRALAYAITRAPTLASAIRARGQAFGLSVRQMEILAAATLPEQPAPWELLHLTQASHMRMQYRVAKQLGVSSMDEAVKQLLLDTLVIRGEAVRPGYYARMRGAS